MSNEKKLKLDKSVHDIKTCVKKLEKLERECRRDGDIRRAAIIRKAIAQLKIAQRLS